jgi:hypothetical protein
MITRLTGWWAGLDYKEKCLNVELIVLAVFVLVICTLAAWAVMALNIGEV